MTLYVYDFQLSVENRSYGQAVRSKAPPLQCGRVAPGCNGSSTTAALQQEWKEPYENQTRWLLPMVHFRLAGARARALVLRFSRALFPHSSSFQRRSLKPFLKVNHNSRSNISSLSQPSPQKDSVSMSNSSLISTQKNNPNSLRITSRVFEKG